MKKKLLLSLLVIVGLFTITGCGKSNVDKMVKTLKNNGFDCVESSDERVCTKESNKTKKTFTLNDSDVNYEETIYDSGIERVVIKISNKNYGEHDNIGYTGIISAYFHGEDQIEFFPENCTDRIDCYLHVNEKVYPDLKDSYDRYKEYFDSESYRDYLRLKNKSNKSTQEKYEEFRLETTFEIYSKIKDNDVFTENVNDALRYYEKMLDEAGIDLED